MMSDLEVNLVNDNMQEFYVRFYGPPESTSRVVNAIVQAYAKAHHYMLYQLPSLVVSGRSMLSSQISTRSSHPASAS